MDSIEGKLYSPFLKTTKKSFIRKSDDGVRGWTFDYKLESNWERFDATVNKIRITEGFPIKTFRQLVDEVAIVTLNNKSYEMFYRGQKQDYKDSQGIFFKDKTPRTIIYPTICRPEKKADGTYKASIKKTQIIRRYDNLLKMMKLGGQEHNYYDEHMLALFQHYDILPTPLIDITQSLRVAATFALHNSLIGYLYVFGLPYPNGSISHYVDQNILLIKLQNVCSVDAYRPRYQEGYLVGKLPIMPTKEGGDNLARRLVAKFKLDNTQKTFWDKNFRPMPTDVLFPKDDKTEKKLLTLKENFERRYGRQI